MTNGKEVIVLNQLIRIKVGTKLEWAERCKPGWARIVRLSKREVKYLKETGWPRKLPDVYQGPDV